MTFYCPSLPQPATFSYEGAPIATGLGLEMPIGFVLVGGLLFLAASIQGWRWQFHDFSASPIGLALCSSAIAGGAFFAIPNRLAFVSPNLVEPALIFLTAILMTASLAVLVRIIAAAHVWSDATGLQHVLLAIPIILMLHGLVVGLANGNPLQGLLSDTARWWYTAFGVTVAVTATKAAVERFARVSLITFLVLDGIWALLLIRQLLEGSYNRFGSGSIAVAAWGGALFAAGRGEGSRLAGIAMIVASSALAVASQTRGFIAATLIAGALPVVSQSKPTLPKVAAVLILLPSLVAGAFYTLSFLSVRNDTPIDEVIDPFREISQAHGFSDVDSLDYRLREISSAAQPLRTGDYALSVGEGSGATYMLSGEETHQIHFTPMSVLFRHGASGVVLAGLWVLMAFMLSVRGLRRFGTCFLTVWAGATCVAVILLSLSTYLLFGQVFVGFLVGLLSRKDMHTQLPQKLVPASPARHA